MLRIVLRFKSIALVSREEIPSANFGISNNHGRGVGVGIGCTGVANYLLGGENSS